MGSFGDKLRRERELRAVTLDEIAEATKIGTRSLKALEDEHFDILPGGIFNKGFVRAYAKYLGIDEEQAVADYVAAVVKNSPSAAPTDEAVVASIAKKRSEPEKPIGVDDGGSSKIWVALAVVALLAGGGYSTWRYYQQRQAQQMADAAAIQTQTAPVVQTPPAAEPQTTPTPEAVPATDSTASTTSAAIAPVVGEAAAATEFTLTLHTTEEAWVSIQADGKTAVQGLLSPDTNRTITAKEKIVVKVGKPGALEVSFNGTPVGPLGPPDRTVTRTFTAEGIQQ